MDTDLDKLEMRVADCVRFRDPSSGAYARCGIFLHGMLGSITCRSSIFIQHATTEDGPGYECAVCGTVHFRKNG